MKTTSLCRLCSSPIEEVNTGYGYEYLCSRMGCPEACLKRVEETVTGIGPRYVDQHEPPYVDEMKNLADDRLPLFL